MIGLKSLGSIFVFLSCGIFGILKAYDLRTRIKRLENILCFTNQLKTTLCYTLGSPYEIFRSIGENSDISCDFILQTVFNMEKGMDFKESLNLATESSQDISVYDKPIVKKLSGILGCYDKETQFERLNLLISEIEKKIDEQSEGIILKQKLCLTLGASLGSILAIILI